MRKRSLLLLLLLCAVCCGLHAVQLNSIYQQRPNDPEAYYFTPENYGIKADGKMDVSDALQAAINQVKKEKNFGILFIPEGKYKISKTIYIPTAVRLIGYGKKRPEIILAKNSPASRKKCPATRARRSTCSGSPGTWWKKAYSPAMPAPAPSTAP